MRRAARPAFPEGARPGLSAPTSWPREAFFPVGTPYLGQSIPGEPARGRGVLSANRSVP